MKAMRAQRSRKISGDRLHPAEYARAPDGQLGQRVVSICAAGPPMLARSFGPVAWSPSVGFEAQVRPFCDRLRVEAQRVVPAGQLSETERRVGHRADAVKITRRRFVASML